MERKTKQRIIGALVIAGFIVIMLPFFQSSKDIPGEPTIIKAPPFPDQAIQVSETPTPNLSDNTTTPAVDDEINEPKPQSTDLMGVNRPAIVENTKPTTVQLPEAIVDEPASNQGLAQPLASTDKQVEEKSKKPTSLAKNKKKVKSNVLPSDDNGLAKIPEAAWVIQIGSFKNKANALQLVNELRVHGYKAFIQQVSTSLGNSTRVFVGPEEKHATARALAVKMKDEMQINGIVISYKPLSL